MGKASKRKAVRKEIGAGNQGQRQRQWLASAREKARQSAAFVLESASPGAALHAIAENNAQVADHLISQVQASSDAMRAQGQPISRIACRKGCGMCCYVNRVMAYPHEVLLTVAWILGQTPDRQAEIRRDIHHYLEATAEDGTDLRRVPCPLLVDEACSAYTHRPSACRVYNSVDLQKCRNQYERPNAKVLVPQLMDQHTVVRAILDGTNDAIEAAGMPARPVRFVKALAIALEDPSCATRYAAGEDVFAQAADPRFELALAQAEG